IIGFGTSSKYIMIILTVSTLVSCNSYELKQDLHSKKSHELGILTANYRILSRVTGKGCLKKNLIERFDQIENKTYFAGLPFNTREDKVKSLAMYNASESALEADIFIHTSTVYTQTKDQICAEVRAIAGKLNQIGDAKL
ncbi:MAG: hypothetical protein JJT78_18515, partial [Leptospira sp.]|nr:hypothetical protein [Leptospira sp.]